MPKSKIEINRAPVLTLWAVVVAERLGHDPDEALTLGRSLAGLNAHSKGKRLGIFGDMNEETSEKPKKDEGAGKLIMVPLLGRLVPALKTPHGLRAAASGKPVDPQSVQHYLEQKFGDRLPEARLAMEELARARTAAQLEAQGFALYEKFRPQIPEGKKGWGAKGELDLERIRALRK